MSRATNIRLYKTLIRPVVCYGAEIWSLLEVDISKLRIFERKIVRRIYGAVFDGEIWRIRNNEEIEEILKNEDIVRFIKAGRLRWIGHVERMSADHAQKKIMISEMYGKRRRGRPRSRWIDEIEKDLIKMGKRNWRTTALDRERWKVLVKKAKGHIDL